MTDNTTAPDDSTVVSIVPFQKAHTAYLARQAQEDAELRRKLAEYGIDTGSLGFPSNLPNAFKSTAKPGLLS